MNETEWHKMQPFQPRQYACWHIDHDITIDGDLTKPEWQEIPFSEDFVDIEGSRKPKPRYRTRIKMRWSHNYWYFAAELEEPNIWAKLTEKNSIIFQDNDFEIFIDPDSDNINYYEFEINALNTIWELNLPFPYKDNGTPINPYNLIGLYSAVNIQGRINDPQTVDQSWSVEVAIPWNGLKSFHQKELSRPCFGDYWRVNFSRVEWDVESRDGEIHKVPNRAENNWVWSPQGVIDMHRPEKWGFAYFVEPETTAPEKYPNIEILKNHALELYYLQRYFKNNPQKNYLDESEIRTYLSRESSTFFQELLFSSQGQNYLAHFYDRVNEFRLFISDKSQIL